MTEKLERKDDIRNIKIDPGMNPDNWNEELSSKVQRLTVDFSETIGEEEIIHIILRNLPDEYDSLKLDFIRQRRITVEPLTLDSMIQKMKNHWKYRKKVDLHRLHHLIDFYS